MRKIHGRCDYYAVLASHTYWMDAYGHVKGEYFDLDAHPEHFVSK